MYDKTFGIVFEKDNIEAEVGEELTDLQWQGMKFELEDAMAFYFERDLAEIKQDFSEGFPVLSGSVDLESYSVQAKSENVGGFWYTRSDVEEIFGAKLGEDVFCIVVDLIHRGFKKYFVEECDRLWDDIDSIVEAL